LVREAYHWTNVVTITASDYASIPEASAKCLYGKNEKNKTVSVIVYNGQGGVIKACFNKCKHMDAKFAPDIEDIGKMKCTFHGWKLDPATMTYADDSNPALAGFTIARPEGEARKQDELVAKKNEDGSLTLTVPDGVKPPGGCVMA
jgi:nitrite reductase/ring-hydroxylating ferredoxin subunit